MRPGEVRRVYLVVARAKEQLGWEARVGLQEGVRRTVEWVRRLLRNR